MLGIQFFADSSQSIPSTETVITQSAARRMNRNNQKAKKALAATSTEATPERNVESGKRTHTVDGDSLDTSHPTKKARLDSTLHLQESQSSLTGSAPVAVEPTFQDQSDVIDSVALIDADLDEETNGAEVVNAVLAAEEAGLEQALAEVNREEDTKME